MSKNFKVGQVWRDGYGRKHTILATSFSGKYPVQTSCDFGQYLEFTANGLCSEGMTTPYDLLELIYDAPDNFKDFESENIQLRKALRYALEWIDAVPKDTLLPTMPGFDRDWVNEVLEGGNDETDN